MNKLTSHIVGFILLSILSFHNYLKNISYNLFISSSRLGLEETNNFLIDKTTN